MITQRGLEKQYVGFKCENKADPSIFRYRNWGAEWGDFDLISSFDYLMIMVVSMEWRAKFDPGNGLRFREKQIR